MTTALAVRPEITPDKWALIRTVAPDMHQSRLFGVTSASAAAAVMLKGVEFGLGLTASFEFVQIIDGKPSLSPRGALAILHGSPLIERIEVSRLTDDKGVYVGHDCTIRRKNGFEYTARFTLADATRAKLIKDGSGWAKYPENMCLWRAIGFAADVAAPDIIGGLKTADQYGAAVDAQGDVVAGQWESVDDVAADGTGVYAPPDETGDVAAAAEALLAEYGPERVLQANGGAIPTTLEEIDALRYRLITEVEEE